MSKTATLLTLAFVLASLVSGCHHGSHGHKPIRTITIYGQEVDDLLPARDKIHVLYFMSARCSATSAMAEEMARIAKLYSPSKFSFFPVFVDRNVEKNEIQTFLFHHGFQSDAIQDKNHDLVRHFGITATPEVVVISHPQVIIYQGRINDMLIDLGTSKTVIEKHDLRQVLDTLASSKKISPGKTEPVGSRIQAPD